jgi:hypothetical protein
MKFHHKAFFKNNLPETILLSLSFVILSFLVIQIPLFQYGRDQGIYAVIGRIILEGGAPYKNAWDFKPPGIYFIYAMANLVFGDSMHAVRILELLSFLLLLCAFIIFTRRHFSYWRAVIIGCTLASLNYVQLDFWDTGQPESFGAVFLAWALVFATYQPSAQVSKAFLRQLISWFCSGMLFAIAALLKPTLGGGFLFSLAIVSFQQFHGSTNRNRSHALSGVILSFFSGALLMVLVCFMFFMAKGALADIYDIFFKFVPHYTSISFSAQKLPRLVAGSLYRWLFSFSLLNTIGLFLVFLLPPVHSREREGYFHLLGIIITQILGIALQAKFFVYHFGAILPFTSLLAAWGFWKLWMRITGKWLLLAGFLLMIAWQMEDKEILPRSILRLHALISGEAGTHINDKLHTKLDVNAGANRLAAQWLSENTPKNLPVYIWGFEPAIYDLADRYPASKYIYNVPQRTAWGKAVARKTLMQELALSPPSAIVVVHRDQIPRVTGNQLDSAEEMKGFPELTAFIRNSYEYKVSFEDLDIYVKKGTFGNIK